jgi:uncharacterized protein YqjF (DUF2071 family)
MENVNLIPAGDKIGTTFLSAKWENLIMANYAVSPEVLKPYLPKGTELDYYHGETFVSLVGFMFKKTSLFNIPIPFLGTFEEINLRFYVTRKVGDSIKRGVVFINETVPYRLVAWLANKLYKEHYTAVRTRNSILVSGTAKTIRYEWEVKNAWNHLEINALTDSMPMQVDSMEEFIFEHYFGYTRINEEKSLEYRIRHPRWQITDVSSYSINCDFESMYGKDFKFLNNCQPSSVIFADGSNVTVDWKRRKL